MSYLENPYGDRTGEIDYSASAVTNFPVIRGSNGSAALEITLGRQISELWDLRAAKITEKMTEDGLPRTHEGVCVFVGASVSFSK